MSLTSDIQNLPSAASDGMPGHLDNHRVIHAALKDHETRLGLKHHVGTGSPEGRITATVGTQYTDQAATNGAILWIKASGTGNRGWRVTEGTTGWRDISDSMGPGWSGQVSVKRTRDDVFVRVAAATQSELSDIIMVTLPAGMINESVGIGIWRGSLYELSILPTPIHRVYLGAGDIRVGSGLTGKSLYGELSWTTANQWPDVLPGSPV